MFWRGRGAIRKLACKDAFHGGTNQATVEPTKLYIDTRNVTPLTVDTAEDRSNYMHSGRPLRLCTAEDRSHFNTAEDRSNSAQRKTAHTSAQRETAHTSAQRETAHTSVLRCATPSTRRHYMTSAHSFFARSISTSFILMPNPASISIPPPPSLQSPVTY